MNFGWHPFAVVTKLDEAIKALQANCVIQVENKNGITSGDRISRL